MLASVLILVLLTGPERAQSASSILTGGFERFAHWIDRWRNRSAGCEQLCVEFLQMPRDEADPQPFVVRIYRPIGTHEALKVALIVGGTVTAGEDFLPPPPIVTIPHEQPHIDINIFQIDDDEGEGRETIEISAFRVR